MAHYIKRYPSKESIKFLEDLGFHHVASISSPCSSWNLNGITWTFDLKQSPTNIEELIVDILKTGVDVGIRKERRRIAENLTALTSKLQKDIIGKS